MATKRPAFTWENGYQAPMSTSTWPAPPPKECALSEEAEDYVAPPEIDLVSSPTHNHLGVNVINSWPTIYDGTNNPHGVPAWWKPQEKVDVLISGAGPSGLGLAVSLARQGVSFRIIDKAPGPLVAGRADGVQPRFLETVAMFGLSSEIAEEGPLIDRTAFYKDGEKILFNRSHQSDSRYRGLHVITQSQIERIYIRDLLRHKSIVERSSILSQFTTDGSGPQGSPEYPVCATIHNEKTGIDQVVQAKFLVGTDGGSSSVRKGLNIPFDGQHSDHGCCCIIPREDGYIRLYTQLDISKTGPISASRLSKDPTFAESGGNVDVHSITPDEVLEQANKIFAPYTLKFATTLSWFSIWKISERVARSYSSPDMRVHLAGDAAHIHSVLGAFGLNASILDISNLAWKLGFAAKGHAKIDRLLPTYGSERRKHAVRIIEVSGEYLRYVCGSSLAVVNLNDPDALDKWSSTASATPEAIKVKHVNGFSKEEKRKKDNDFISSFFKRNGQFLLGTDCEYDTSDIAPPTVFQPDPKQAAPLRIKNAVRAPNPRVCFQTSETGYLYDKLNGPARFHVVVFASSFTGSRVLAEVRKFASHLKDPQSFYQRLGKQSVFNVVLVVKALPFELETFSDTQTEVITSLTESCAQIVFDDRSPDEDAHNQWGVNHHTGGLAVIRPDLWVGATFYPGKTAEIDAYFDGFLQSVE
ncbi:FAD binding domain-containing protein [Stachybotrys elegans]|uniref:FAD binding domain-containing protein n=1 Tax=Stachybotrys elegans TaxID=80388 RepID=A0A8K0T0C4_9HYPO|nr:FAD binding domain-containing protein [Stachybotrys elegans]